MFDYNLKKLKEDDDVIAVIVKIKKWDGYYDEKRFLGWLDTGCRVMSDGKYEIKKL